MWTDVNWLILIFQVVLASCLFMQAVASPIFPFDLFKRGRKQRQSGYSAPRPAAPSGGYNSPAPAPAPSPVIAAAPAVGGYNASPPPAPVIAAAPAQSGYGAAQACRTEYDQQCTTVNEQQCSTVNRQQCSTVQEQQCSTVNEQVRIFETES